MHGSAQRGRVAVVAWLATLLLAGCGASSTPTTGSATSSASVDPSSSSAPVVVPADGAPLRDFGVINGPGAAFSLPRTTVLTVVVDQPRSVSLVIATPGSAAVYDYLLEALPAAGFGVTDQVRATDTLTFAGRGWTGSLTGDARACAVLLRPA